MAYQKGFYQIKEKEPFEEKELLYDLRQAFVIVTTEIKKQIITASLSKDYTFWYDLIDRLFIEISKNLSIEEIKEYEKLKEKSDIICRKYSSTFLKKSSDNATEIYDALRTLDLWLNRKMNEKNMYGSKEIDDVKGL
jgi:hypothetical protein